MKRPKKGARVVKRPRKAKETSRDTDEEPVGLSGLTNVGTSYISGQFAISQEILTSSPEETFELARNIAGSLTGTAIILLSGDLGAGKTVFAKGIAAGLGIDPADVTSPSFTLINLHHGRLRFYHVDLYRLDSSGCGGLGLEEIFEDPGAVIAIEWAERMPSLPKQAMGVHIEYVNDSSRKILMSGPIAEGTQRFDDQVRSR